MELKTALNAADAHLRAVACLLLVRDNRKHEEREAAYIQNTQRKRAENGVDAFVGPPRCGMPICELLPCSAVCLLVCAAPRFARCHALHGMLEMLDTSLHRPHKGERVCRLVLRRQLGASLMHTG